MIRLKRPLRLQVEISRSSCSARGFDLLGLCQSNQLWKNIAVLARVRLAEGKIDSAEECVQAVVGALRRWVGLKRAVFGADLILRLFDGRKHTS
jgi:hypothetical protein